MIITKEKSLTYAQKRFGELVLSCAQDPKNFKVFADKFSLDEVVFELTVRTFANQILGKHTGNIGFTTEEKPNPSYSSALNFILANDI